MSAELAGYRKGCADGGVHALFTIVGRSDIGFNGCTAAVLPPIDFEAEYRKGNLSFRIPLQAFGLGLIEGDSGQNHSEQLRSHSVPSRVIGDRRHSESKRQRRHDHALRLESAEQVHSDVRR